MASFTIFKDQSIPDIVLQNIQRFKPSTIIKYNDTPFTAAKVRVSMMMNSIHLYKALQQHFDVDQFSTDSAVQNAEYHTFIHVEKIGACTGDLIVTITGDRFQVHEVILLLLNAGEPTELADSILTVLKPENVIEQPAISQVNCEIVDKPFGLMRRQLAVLSSTSAVSLVDAVVKFYSEPSAKQNFTSSNEWIGIQRPRRALSQINCIRFNQTTETEMVPKSEENAYKLVQLTRKEVTYLIGKNGGKIDEIRKRSGAYVRVLPLNNEMNLELKLFKSDDKIQFIRVSGSNHQIQKALAIIESEIYQYRSFGITRY